MDGPGEVGVEDADRNKQKSKPDGKAPRSWSRLVYKMVHDVFLFVTVLYSVIGVISNAGVSKERASPPPSRFFHRDSLVQDYWRGNVFRAFQDATQFENSFIMYYAAWDADSQEARATMEAVAEFFADTDILVAAVNCWYPTSQCAKEFGTKTHSHPFPVFIFYPRELKGIQYRGPVSPEYVIAFIRNCRYPLKHLGGKEDFNQLQTDHSSVLVGFSPTTSHTTSDHNYRALQQVSLSLLEYDPHRELAVAAVTCPTLARQLHLHLSQPVRLFTWNATQVYPNKTIDRDKLLQWAVKSDSRPTTWLNLPGKKSLVLQHSLSSGTGYSLLVFTSRNPLLPNGVYNAMRGIAAAYNNCNNTEIVNENINRLDDLDDLAEEVDCDLVTNCRLTSWAYDSLDQASPACHLVRKNNASCDTKLKPSKTAFSSDENVNILADEYDREDIHVRAMKRAAALERTFPPRLPTPVVREKGCDSNRTLTMFALDAARYTSFLASLGLDANPLPVSVIINAKDESLFLPPPTKEGSSFRQALSEFIASWHAHSVSATSGGRSSDVGVESNQSSRRHVESNKANRSFIDEVNADMFLNAVNEKDKDVVLFYTSSYCSSCTAVSYVLHAVAKYFSELATVKFVMIDASKNDLPWQYTTLSFPTVIVFPKNRSASSRVFPSHKSLSITNLLSFVVSNVAPEVRLWLALKHCDSACISKTRVSAVKTVGDLLSMARRRPWSSARPDIANKLRFAKTLLYVLAAWEADKTKSPNVSRRYFRAILDSFSPGKNLH